jgi:hypothetical protein
VPLTTPPKPAAADRERAVDSSGDGQGQIDRDTSNLPNDGFQYFLLSIDDILIAPIRFVLFLQVKNERG